MTRLLALLLLACSAPDFAAPCIADQTLNDVDRCATYCWLSDGYGFGSCSEPSHCVTLQPGQTAPIVREAWRPRADRGDMEATDCQ